MHKRLIDGMKINIMQLGLLRYDSNELKAINHWGIPNAEFKGHI